MNRSSDKYSIDENAERRQDLFQNSNEWIKVPNVVKITFKTLFDIIRSQSESIKILESNISLKASKEELNNSIANKVNLSDFTQTTSELNFNISSNVNLFKNLNEKVSKLYVTN